MFKLTGGLTIVVHTDRDVSYAEVEDALQSEAFLTDYLINRSTRRGRTEFTISVHVPTSAITADGIPYLDAAQTLRSLADVITKLDAKG